MNMQELQAAALAEYESDHRMHLAGLAVDDAIKTFEANLPEWGFHLVRGFDRRYEVSSFSEIAWEEYRTGQFDDPAKALIICMLMCMIAEKEQD